MQETLIKTHLIVVSTHEEYHMNWCGKIIDTKPKIKNNKPIFTIVSSKGRMEINTADIKKVEDCAKRLTEPKVDNQLLLIQQESLLLKKMIKKL